MCHNGEASKHESTQAIAVPFMSTHSTTISSRHTKPSVLEEARTRAAELSSPVDFFHLFWIFVIVSVVGLFIETVVSYPVDGVWKDRAGLVWGPFSPIYGLGAVLITAIFYRVRNVRGDVLFILLAIFGGTFEYLVGVFWYHAFGFVAWNYSGMPFNFGNYTCLPIALCWGIIGLLWIKLLLPIVIDISECIPLAARTTATGICAVLMAADVALTLTAFNCWFERSSGNPVDTPLETYFAQNYSDEFMGNRFETISMYTDLATR